MFKLVKILDGKTNVPETVRLRYNSNFSCKAGDLLVIGEIYAQHCYCTDLPTYVALQDIQEGGSGMLLAHPVLPTHVYETAFYGTERSNPPSGYAAINYDVGSLSSRGVDVDRADGKALIIDASNVHQEGDKILVQFI